MSFSLSSNTVLCDYIIIQMQIDLIISSILSAFGFIMFFVLLVRLQKIDALLVWNYGLRFSGKITNLNLFAFIIG